MLGVQKESGGRMIPGVMEAGKRADAFVMLPEPMPIPAFARLLQVSQTLTPSDPPVAAGSSAFTIDQTWTEATLFRA